MKPNLELNQNHSHVCAEIPSSLPAQGGSANGMTGIGLAVVVDDICLWNADAEDKEMPPDDAEV